MVNRKPSSTGKAFAIVAGCFGTDGLGASFPADLSLRQFTAITLKSSTLQPRPSYAGNGYHLNAIGLRNPGIRAVLNIHLPHW